MLAISAVNVGSALEVVVSIDVGGTIVAVVIESK